MASKKIRGREGLKGTPREGFPLETPFYEERIDPYFQETLEPQSPDEDKDLRDPEDDWYWREPENIWQDEGMWPWPEPAPRARRTDPHLPDEVRPERN
jgi:hypothetical protein